MIIDRKSLGIIGIMVLAFWLSFIFIDGSFSTSSPSPTITPPTVQQTVPADDVNPDSLAAQLSVATPSLDQEHSAAPASGDTLL